MSNAYIMIIEEGIKSFSLIGHGNDCRISFAVKGQTAPLDHLCAGDKVVGYISNAQKRFAYLFEVQKSAEADECVIVKLFESATGPLLDSMDDDVKNTVQSREQTESLIAITEEQYHKIVAAMLSACAAAYVPKRAGGAASAMDEAERRKGGMNVILYGVPGCGKSHEIKTKYCNDKRFMQRVVFHPDYTYSDFVGQILPKTEGEKISYSFTEGPFTAILRKAIHHPENMYYLVIEEINRGNAPAIFGEVFQLLDRENGESEYGIHNFDIAKCIYGPEGAEEEIKIPSNLTILATMNTADQNVFTLDTAFKRRWTLRSIENNIHACDHAAHQICGTPITWEAFATKINDTIIDIGEGNLGSEDNRLGAYFVKAGDLQDERVFAEKVLMYLWNDAFKYDRDKVFRSEYRTLEDLLKGFYAHKFGVFVPQLGFNDPVSQAGAAARETGSVDEG